MSRFALALIAAALCVGGFLALGPQWGRETPKTDPEPSSKAAQLSKQVESMGGSTQEGPAHVAEAGHEASPEFAQSENADERVLVAAPSDPVSFRTLGTVEAAPGLTLEEGANVSIFALSDVGRIQVAGTEVSPGGEWGPLDIPLLSPGDFLARYESPNGVTKETVIPRPSDGDTVRLDFVSEQGHPLWFEVLNDAEAQIDGVRVTGSWSDEQGRPIQRSGTPRPDGYVRLAGLQPGPVTTQFQAPGYETITWDPITVPEDPPTLYAVYLKRAAATIVGQCLNQGSPVDDFDLLCWQEIHASTRRVAFRKAAGRFTLTGVRPGTVFMSAASTAGTHSRPIAVDVPEEGELEVTLELLGTRQVRGQVVDAITGSPLPNATIQPLLQWLGTTIGVTGRPRSVDSNGSFHGIDATLEGQGFRFACEGYGTRDLEASASSSDFDFQKIELHRLAPLSIQLVSETRSDFSPFTLKLRTQGASVYQFPEDGLLSIPLGPGPVLFTVGGPDKWMTTIDARLSESEEWYREILVDEGRRLHITVTPAEGEEPPSYVTILAAYFNEHGEQVALRQSGSPTPLTLKGIHGDSVDLQLFVGKTLRARRQFTLTGETDQYKEIYLGGFGATVLILDADGRPIPGARVFGVSAEEGEGYIDGLTDAQGKVHFSGVKQSEVLLNVHHELHGTLNAVRETLSSDGSKLITITLDGSGTVEVQLTKQGLPVAGIEALLLGENRLAMAGSATSDGDGILRWTKLAPARYALYVAEEGYWPNETPIVLGDDDVRVTSELIPMGQLEVAVTTTTGLPVEGLALSFQYLPTGEYLWDWMQADRWRAPDGGLQTDREGRLTLRQIPAGAYAWSFTTSAGDPFSGLAHVEGGQTAPLNIAYPE